MKYSPQKAQNKEINYNLFFSNLAVVIWANLAINHKEENLLIQERSFYYFNKGTSQKPIILARNIAEQNEFFIFVT